jgi:hypothetical protein
LTWQALLGLPWQMKPLREQEFGQARLLQPMSRAQQGFQWPARFVAAILA